MSSGVVVCHGVALPVATGGEALPWNAGDGSQRVGDRLRPAQRQPLVVRWRAKSIGVAVDLDRPGGSGGDPGA